MSSCLTNPVMYSYGKTDRILKIKNFPFSKRDGLGCVLHCVVVCFIDSLAASANDPIAAQFSETLGGLATIRAFQKQTKFLRDLQVLCD